MEGFAPLHDRVMLRRIEAEVMVVGPGARDEMGKIVPLGVTVGDRVLFGKWTGTDVIIDGEERLIVKESEIFGVIKTKTRAANKAG